MQHFNLKEIFLNLKEYFPALSKMERIKGGLGDSSYTGAAWVFIRSSGVWVQQGSKLVGTGAIGSAWQGYSVSLSADGNTAIVGGMGDSSGMGAVWVFIRSGGIWTQQGNKLVGSGAIGAAHQGTSISISSDGNTILSGGSGDNNSEGAAWVFTRTSGVWTQQGNKLIGTSSAGSGQGNSVAISSDGNTSIIGGQGDGGGIGAVWMYTRTGGVWTQQGNKLVGTGFVGNSSQGNTVSISYSGDTAVVGGLNDNSNTGAVWIYTRTSNIWTQLGSKLIGTGAVNSGNGVYQGWSVAISSDGHTIIEGGRNDSNGFGAAWVFYNSASGIGEVNNSKETISIFPNPTTSTITIHQDTYSPNQQIIISDVLGNKVYSQALNTATETIDISHLRSGIYFYEVKGSGLQIPTSVRGKIIKE